jgi:hypothetical protein
MNQISLEQLEAAVLEGQTWSYGKRASRKAKQGLPADQGREQKIDVIDVTAVEKTLLSTIEQTDGEE